MSLTAELQREQGVRDRKPVLALLLADVRRAAEEMPSCGRRDQLEGIVAYFSKALRESKSADVTQAEADAFRETWGIKPRNTKAPALP